MKPLFKDFDFSIVEDADFREDSVREELIVPLLAALGYSASGKDRIVRSRPLQHPFVYIGTRKQPINVIPDYLLQREGENSWILDAKAPGENIADGSNVEQAYSYAIHKDVRVPFYALCNGRHFVLFHISRWPAVLQFALKEIQHHWEHLLAFVGATSALGMQRQGLVPLRHRRKSHHLRKHELRIGASHSSCSLLMQVHFTKPIRRQRGHLQLLNALWFTRLVEFVWPLARFENTKSTIV